MIISLFEKRIRQNILILLTLLFLSTTVKTEDIEPKIVDLSFNTSTSQYYFEQGVPSITHTNQKLFSSNNHYQFLPNFLSFDVDPLDEDNIYIFLDSKDDVIFHFTGEFFPSFPEYKINLKELTMTKCMEELSCENLHCNTISVTTDSNRQVQNNSVYIAWRKENGLLKLLLQNNKNILTCQDNSNILDFEKISMQASTQQSIRLTTSYPFMFTTEIDEILISKNFTINSNETLIFYTLLCDTCKLYLNLICNNDSDSTIIYSGNGWQELSLDGPNLNGNTCYLKATTRLSDTAGYSGSSNTFWGFTKNGFLLQQKTTVKTRGSSGSRKLANTCFSFVVLLFILLI